VLSMASVNCAIFFKTALLPVSTQYSKSSSKLFP
jgi:hypothetical protein